MRGEAADPSVQVLLDEAYQLPECTARNTLFERAAVLAETLGDLDIAWEARCSILQASETYHDMRFENLFLSVAWCLALSDRDPERFPASRVLWQYKWVATTAAEYASISADVLRRIVDDMNTRFLGAGWGPRAGLHKKLQILKTLNRHDEAAEGLEQWRTTGRDRGADCNACECAFEVELLLALGRDEEAVKRAAPLIRGRLSCSTVPQSIFDEIAFAQARLGKLDKARELFDRGRRLIAGMDLPDSDLIDGYLLFAASDGQGDLAESLLRIHLPRVGKIYSDEKRCAWFANVALAAARLDEAGHGSIETRPAPGVSDGGVISTRQLTERCQRIADQHAEALDLRNGNDGNARWIRELPEKTRLPAPA
ncbi:MAG: hypothetical protein AAGI53_10000 [Planctomycetota bacterium]